jgi:hypothetical protein
MIRQLAKYEMLFKTERADIHSHIYIVSSTETTMDIIVSELSNLDGCKAIYVDKTYDVKLVKHILQVGIGASQQYKYHLTKEVD